MVETCSDQPVVAAAEGSVAGSTAAAAAAVAVVVVGTEPDFGRHDYRN